MRIDCQSHIFPREYAELLARNESEPRAIPRGSMYLITYGRIQHFLMDPETYRVDGILADMDIHGIDMSVLCVNMPGPESLPPNLGIEGARLINDNLAEIVQRHPDRFVGIAALPWQSVPAALAELDRAVERLNLRGAMLYSRVGDTPVDSPDLDPVYSRLAALDRPLVLHPTVPPLGRSGERSLHGYHGRRHGGAELRYSSTDSRRRAAPPSPPESCATALRRRPPLPVG